MITQLLAAIIMLASSDPSDGKPEVFLRWINPGNEEIAEARLQGGDDIIEPCIQNGLELRLKFEIKSCLRRSGWFDKCTDPILATRSVDYDPIGERYRVQHDLRGDQYDPEESTVGEQESAVSLVRVAPNLPVDLTVRGKKAEYLKARVTAECRGSGARTLERLSSFLSLGLISTPGFQTQWFTFDLKK